MKPLLALLALLAITNTALADAGGPIRKDNKCWAVTDSSRGFGFWDRCASNTQIRKDDPGLTITFDRAVSQTALDNTGGDGGGGGGGGR